MRHSAEVFAPCTAHQSTSLYCVLLANEHDEENALAIVSQAPHSPPAKVPVIGDLDAVFPLDTIFPTKPQKGGRKSHDITQDHEDEYHQPLMLSNDRLNKIYCASFPTGLAPLPIVHYRTIGRGPGPTGVSHVEASCPVS